MSYGYLALSVLGALLVFNAYQPRRWEPLSVISFFAGWMVGELPVQMLVVSAVLTLVFGLQGAFGSWPGQIGLVLLGACALGLAGLAVAGHRSGQVVARALGEATGPPFAMVPVPPRPEWGKWWRLTQAVPLRGRSVEMVKNIDYWGDGAVRHRLDVIRARGTTPSSAPVMVYIHGGAWVVGNKREQGKPMLYELVSRGWVCVTINYRLSPKATWPDHIVDVKRALAWVKANIADYGGDPSFVALSGGSAGGHLSALAALTPGELQWQPGFEDADTSVDACVPFYGVMDLTGDRPEEDLGLRSLLEKRVMKVAQSADPQRFVEASPTFRVNAGAPPFFVLHGTNDTLVPVTVAQRFVASLREVSRAPVAYAEMPLAQHAFDVLASLRCQATTEGVVAFLDAVRATRPTQQSTSAAGIPSVQPMTSGDDPASAGDHWTG